MKKAVFLYDFTGLMAQPWLDDGYECWIFDGQHAPGITREGNLVRVGMWFYPKGLEYQAATIKSMVGDGVEMVFGFPECTFLTVAANKWMSHPEDKHLPADLRRPNPRYPDRKKSRDEAVELAKLVEAVGCAFGCKWGLENPISVLSTLWRKPDFRFDPCDYAGHLPESDSHPVYPEIYPGRDRYNKNTCIWMGGEAVMPEKKRIEPISKDNPGWKKCGGKSLRTKNIRSATPRGFAKAWKDANS